MPDNEGNDVKKEAAEKPVVTHFNVAPSPHLSDRSITTRRVMIDVLIGLVPLFGWACAMFGLMAVKQVLICLVSCLAFEGLFTVMRGKKIQVDDCSAAITGVILALSLPANAPVFVGVIGSAVAIGIGKVVFGGLGFNMFNPAMVGRAFVMLSFAGALGAPAYVLQKSQTAVMALTQATPLTVVKKMAELGTSYDGPGLSGIGPLFLGQVNGSLGEVSALCILVGGIYLCIRKAASWLIPLGAIVSLLVFAALANVLGLTPFSAVQHLVSGAFLFGAFFIATDPVSSPLSKKGRFVFGIGYSALVMVLRVFSSYPEGVMFAVLIMNACVPLINRFTVPTPVGGPVPQKA